MPSPVPHFATPSSLPGPDAVEILDEAVSLLRRAPLSTVSIYFFGALPFALGLIYFCSDMAECADAEARLPGEALLLAALYFWMKTCQAVFARKLLAVLEGEDAERWTATRWLRTAVLQIIYAGSLVLVYPLALLITIPFGWVNAFYHNISVLATSSKSTLASTFREASELAPLWPKQNHLILGIQFLAVFVLFLNLAVFFFLIPQLLNSLFGIETILDENLRAWNNSTFYLNIFVFCFLLLNPLNKAVFVLRCFYGRARFSGADLRAELRRWNFASPGVNSPRTATLALILLTIFATGAQAQPPAPAAAPAVQTAASDRAAGDLDQAIQKTLRKDEFAWRLPREQEASADPGFFTKLVNRCVEYLKNALRSVFKSIGDFLKWLFEGAHDRDSGNQTFSAMAAIPWRALFLLLALVFAGVLVYVALRHHRRRARQPSHTSLKAAPIRTVDLEAENVQAGELPEDSWLALAQQLVERGDLRLALRAFYLATLSALARRELVRLAAAKSNRDYLAELTRRLRGETSVVPFFRENVRLFEASWYGTHAVTLATIDAMRINQQHLQGHAAT